MADFSVMPLECAMHLPLKLPDWIRLMAVCRSARSLSEARLLDGAAFDLDLSPLPREHVVGALSSTARRAGGRLRSLKLQATVRSDRLVGLLTPCLTAELKMLVLKDMSHRLDAAVSGLGARCPQLVHLDLSGSGPVTTALLVSFPRNHPLETLVLTGCSTEACTTELLAALPPLAHLKALDIGVPLAGAEPQLGAGALAAGLLAEAKGKNPYPALLTLGLERQQQLEEEDLAACAAALPGLKHLNLSDVVAGADGVISVAEACNLEVLVLRGGPASPSLMDEDVQQLVAATPGLLVLDISGHTALTNCSLKALASCSRLTKLTLARQSKLTSEGLLGLLLAVGTLNTVVAVRCRHLHKRALQTVSQQLLDSGRSQVQLLLDRDNAGGVWWKQ